MRACVAGGAGFLGSYVIDQLVNNGHSVLLVDDFSTGKRENIQHHTSKDQLQVYRSSVSNRLVVSGVVHDSDVVFHLASPVGVMLVLERPAWVLRSMLEGCATVVDACVRHGKPLVFASSSEVYGTSPKVPTPEDAPVIPGSPESVRWHYAMGKAANEHQVLAAVQEHGLRAVVVRLFNVAGPRQIGRYGMVVPRFVERAINGMPLEVFGNGRQTRSFAHAADVAEAMVALAGCEAASGEVVNLGSDEEVSMNDLAETIIKMLGSPSSVVHVLHEKAYGVKFCEVRRRVPDLSKVRGLIGYEPKRMLVDIIQAVASEYEERLPAGAVR